MQLVRQRGLLLLPLVLVLAACSAGNSTGGGNDELRTIEVSTTDELRFEPAEISVSAGETVRFEVTNDGQTVHEFLIGDEAAQEEFAAEMAEGGGHDATGAGVTVEPGATEPFEYTFEEEGELLAGCHEPGHYEGGMVANITVGE